MVLFLGVTDYHRFHAPVAGRIVEEGRIGGLCFGCDGDPGEVFTEHHRGVFLFETRGFGLVGMFTVGIATVSSVRHLRGRGTRWERGTRWATSPTADRRSCSCSRKAGSSDRLR